MSGNFKWGLLVPRAPSGLSVVCWTRIQGDLGSVSHLSMDTDREVGGNGKSTHNLKSLNQEGLSII